VHPEQYVSASVTRTWIVHVLVIGALALACIGACVAAWPAHSDPSDVEPLRLVRASVLFALHAAVTTWLLGRHRTIAYALHGVALTVVLLA
jgi:hypothetical protein